MKLEPHERQDTEEEIWEQYRRQEARKFARENQDRQFDPGGPWFAWETMNHGYTPMTCGEFNARQGVGVLSYSPPLTKLQANLLCEALNRGEAWAFVELNAHRTRRQAP
jgi:hypothetical protein